MADSDRETSGLWAVLKGQLDGDPVGKAILALLQTDPNAAAEALAEWLDSRRLPQVLATYVSGGQIGKLVIIARVHGSVTIEADSPVIVRPRELPQNIDDFIGRHSELEMITSSILRPPIQGGAAVWVIYGPAGVGKSTLAIHAAHTLTDQFSDGQLYVDLRGSTPGMEPLEPSVALNRMLRSLGVPRGEIDVDAEAAASQFRTVTSGRRLLVILDNASTTKQVTSLLPAAEDCAVLITSRRALTTLPRGTRLLLAPMSRTDAVELLAAIVGAERAAAEQQAISSIAQLCGFLPLALRIAGIHSSVSNVSLKSFADRLASSQILDELEEEEVSVRSSIGVSYAEFASSADRLDSLAALAFRRLGKLALETISLSTAARLVAESERTTQSALTKLVSAQLLLIPQENRYAMHDMVRLYAQSEHARQETDEKWHIYFTRVLDHYLATSRQASYVLQPSDILRAGDAIDRTDASRLETDDDVFSWLESEAANLVDLIRKASEMPGAMAGRAAALAYSLYWPYRIYDYYLDWQMVDELALSAAERTGNLQIKAYLLGDLADVLRRSGQSSVALNKAMTALEIFATQGDIHGQARTSNLVANIHTQEGRWDEGQEFYLNSRRLYQEIHDLHGEYLAVGNLGLIAAERGDCALSHDYLLQLLSLIESLHDPHAKAQVLGNLAESALRLQRPHEAIEYGNEAVASATNLRDTSTLGIALNARGEGYRQIGEVARAVDDQRRAVSIAHDLQLDYSMAEALWKLGLALRDSNRPKQAMACLRRALSIFEKIGAPEAAQVHQLLANPETPSE